MEQEEIRCNEKREDEGKRKEGGRVVGKRGYHISSVPRVFNLEITNHS